MKFFIDDIIDKMTSIAFLILLMSGAIIFAKIAYAFITNQIIYK